jgi:hypothetical protein
VCIDATLQRIDGVIEYFQKYIDVEKKLRTKHQSNMNKHFDEINNEDVKNNYSLLNSLDILSCHC